MLNFELSYVIIVRMKMQEEDPISCGRSCELCFLCSWKKSQPPLFPTDIPEMQWVGRLGWVFGDGTDQVCLPWVFPSQKLLLMALVEVSTPLAIESLLLAMI